jgi:hypothetical protein
MIRFTRALLTCVVVAVSTQAVGQSRLVDAIAGVDRDAAYREGQLQRAELDRAEAETELARATAELARADEEGRRSHEEFVATLARHWERMGLAPDEARSVAMAFEWTQQQDAISDGVRRNGLEATARDIGAAYRAYNYLLANQLLVAYLTVYTETRSNESSPSSSDTRR